MEELIHFDKELLLMLNGSDSLVMDTLIMTLTNALTWIPLYLSLFYVVLKSNDTVRDILLVLAGAGACVLLAGTVDDTIVKPLVARWRPGHDPEIGMLVDTVDGYRGGNYGFFSAHVLHCDVHIFADAPAAADCLLGSLVAHQLLYATLSGRALSRRYYRRTDMGRPCRILRLQGLLPYYASGRIFASVVRHSHRRALPDDTLCRRQGVAETVVNDEYERNTYQRLYLRPA